jgi:ACT domain-containing protein
VVVDLAQWWAAQEIPRVKRKMFEAAFPELIGHYNQLRQKEILRRVKAVKPGSVPEMAAEVGISTRAFYNYYKRVFDLSPKQREMYARKIDFYYVG